MWMYSIVHGWDLAILHWLNMLSGNWLIDHTVNFVAGNRLLNGTVFVAVYWCCWFDNSANTIKETRRVVLGGIVAALIAVVVARLLADLLPYRIRPFLDPSAGFRALPGTSGVDFENWSSFPSDTTAFTVALSLGLYAIAPKLAITLTIYSFIGIGLPRMYLGIHYPSDIIAGAIIGILAAWVCQNIVKGKMVEAVLAYSGRRPQWFYLMGFVATSELAQMFDNVRYTARSLAQLIHRSTFGAVTILACGTIFVLFAIVIVITAFQRINRRAAAKIPNEPTPIVPL